MKKLLIVCGPTATGKTGLALHLSKVFNGEVISADSRQVYKKMDIGTGKDLPRISNFQWFDKLTILSKVEGFPISNLKKSGIGCYCIHGVRIWGYDLVGPEEEFSVAHYLKIANKVIENIWKREKLPILVGGTGLYIKGVVDGIQTASIPRNSKLRKSLKDKTAVELFEILAGFDPIKSASMNISDNKNPRRLVRAIEVAQFQFKFRPELSNVIKDYEALFIGLTAPREFLYRNIERRVDERLKQGLEKEIRNLLVKGVGWDTQSMRSMGYKEWKEYLTGNKSKKEVILEWVKDEKNYIKRQLTWFVKDKRIIWFDISKSGWRKAVDKFVAKWYKSIR
ncbi:hypothetical protein A2685_02575 [Candidatus Woesebacteria bacterium RIFCSPHIGHO2_01_FULL_37_10]|uniref:tRNA dimethylallyltransferase n=1 Tax=Candidatus Woesebacteria bacterium RIFCSPHIGHO2_01_FULL_37_10 TaxID=1802489 RepID=A0A1F7XYE6_9BACT|nr:MAG: hypothetical protein A2685_02575 [Candidatus Woesebacteria bacterium RIFCSPHIGHO2_01_FULL_37_10]